MCSLVMSLCLRDLLVMSLITLNNNIRLCTYGTAHGKVYNRTRVLAWDLDKSCDFSSSTRVMHV